MKYAKLKYIKLKVEKDVDKQEKKKTRLLKDWMTNRLVDHYDSLQVCL